MAFFAEKKAPSGRLFYYQILGGLALVLGLACWLNPNHYAPWVVFENEAMAFASILLASSHVDMSLMSRFLLSIAAPQNLRLHGAPSLRRYLCHSGITVRQERLSDVRQRNSDDFYNNITIQNNYII